MAGHTLHAVGGRVGGMMQWSAGCPVQGQGLRQLWVGAQDDRLDGELLGHLLQVAEALQVTAGAEQAGGRLQLEGRQAAGRGQRSSGTGSRSTTCSTVARWELGRRGRGRGQRQGQREGQRHGAAQVPRLVVVHAEALLAVVGAVGGAARTVLQLQAAGHRRVGAQRDVRVGAVRGRGRNGAICPSAATAESLVLVVLNAGREEGREFLVICVFKYY